MVAFSYIYLHGFASGPQSAKAQYLRDRFQTCDIDLQIPDLNQGDFSHLTLTRQLHQVQTECLAHAAPTLIIGSSLGGLTAAWLGEQVPQVEQLVLLAPAFNFLAHWLPKLGAKQVEHWKINGYLSTYHYAAQQQLPLSYDFVVDACQYRAENLHRPIPTLILHGKQDQVIPVQSSRDFAASRPWVKLVELESDHALANVPSELWSLIQQFCHLNPKK